MQLFPPLSDICWFRKNVRRVTRGLEATSGLTKSRRNSSVVRWQPPLRWNACDNGEEPILRRWVQFTSRFEENFRFIKAEKLLSENSRTESARWRSCAWKIWSFRLLAFLKGEIKDLNCYLVDHFPAEPIHSAVSAEKLFLSTKQIPLDICNYLGSWLSLGMARRYPYTSSSDIWDTKIVFL